MSIVHRAKERIIESYTEIHHIIPRSMGGSDDHDNLVSLTPREHFICHLLLPKITNGEARKKMVTAYILMSGMKKYNSRSYGVYREEYRIINSEARMGSSNGMHGVRRCGEDNPFYGKTHTEETKRRISEKNKGHSRNKGIPFTDEHKRNISIAARKRVPASRLHSEETKRKMSNIALDNNPGFSAVSKCPKCGKEGQKANISKWHGLNGEKCR